MFSDLAAYRDSKRRMVEAANADRDGYDNFDFDTLLDIHDGFVENDDFAAADRVSAALAARPEYPAYQAKIAKLVYEFQCERSGEPESPF